jgi:excisionase family DNA binding protein
MVTVVGDGSQLRTGEAAARLNVGEQTIRDYLTQHLLRAVRTAGGHRRIDAASPNAKRPKPRCVNGTGPLLLAEVRQLQPGLRQVPVQAGPDEVVGVDLAVAQDPVPASAAFGDRLDSPPAVRRGERAEDAFHPRTVRAVRVTCPAIAEPAAHRAGAQDRGQPRRPARTARRASHA